MCGGKNEHKICCGGNVEKCSISVLFNLRFNFGNISKGCECVLLRKIGLKKLKVYVMFNEGYAAVMFVNEA